MRKEGKLTEGRDDAEVIASKDSHGSEGWSPVKTMFLAKAHTDFAEAGRRRERDLGIILDAGGSGDYEESGGK